MTRSTKSRARLCLAAFALVACATRPAVVEPASAPRTEAPARASERDETSARLERLTRELDAARDEHHVPGLSIAVVKDGEIVLATGLGFADLEKKTPATATTVYSIGSSTKAFTATLVGMLVDEGKLAWDDPVAKYVPELQLPIDASEPGATLTIRDALSHRSGFTRMSLLWASGQRDDEEIFRLASKAEPWAKYREKFLYNNVVYASAGRAAARAAGTTWADLVETRIFEPLQMKTTIVDQAQAEADPRRARGYVWRSVQERFEAVPMRAISSIAPAGAIFSNVEEMAQWVRFQLADGEAGGRRLIASETLAETRKPQMAISPTLSYGLGWMLEERDGKAVVQHGGNIDGYAAMVALIPQENLGFVLLTNVSSTPLQSAAAEIVFGAMLDPLEEETAQEEDLDRLAGEYIASFGGFDGEPLVVTARGGKLFVDVPRQMNFEIRPPGADGKRPFAITDKIAVSFTTEKAGRPQVLQLHQNGFTFEALRKGFVPEPEVPVAELRPLLGTYRNDKLGAGKMILQNNRLALVLPGQGAFELQPPDAQGKRPFRAKPDIVVELIARGDKPPTSLTVHQAGQELVFLRESGAESERVPTVDDLMKLRRVDRVAKALEKLGVVELRGRVRVLQSGVEGELVAWLASDGRYAARVDLGKSGTIEEFVYPDRAWTNVSFAPLEEHVGKFLDQARIGHPFALLGDWRDAFDSVEVEGPTTHDGRPAWQVVLRKGELAPLELVVDAKTGDVRSVAHARLLEGAGALPTKSRMSSYRTVHGLRMPMHQEASDDATGKTVIDLTSVRRFRGDPSSVFPTGPTR